MASALLFGLAVGCADDDAGRQFANDAQRESALPTAPPRLITPPRATMPATPVTAQNLVKTRGAAGQFYYEADDAVWTMAGSGVAATPVFAPSSGTVIRALAASPSGDRVAALLVASDGLREQAEIIVLANSGEELFRTSDLGEAAGSDVAQAVSLDWSPQGEKLLVGLDPGGLIMVPIDGSPPTVVVAGGLAQTTSHAAWSPTGDEVGYLAPVATEDVGLYLAAPAGTPVPLLTPEAGDRFIVDWAWLPDGRSLLFSERVAATGSTDLWRIQTDGSDRELIASAGRVAPVAEIVMPTPSRDGRSVAYVVVLPGDDGPQFHSLWVRSLGSNQGFAVPLPPNQSVTDLWWTEAGLMVRTVPGTAYGGGYDGGAFTIFQVAANNEVRVAMTTEQGTPAASPVLGTPVS